MAPSWTSTTPYSTEGSAVPRSHEQATFRRWCSSPVVRAESTRNPRNSHVVYNMLGSRTGVRERGALDHDRRQFSRARFRHMVGRRRLLHRSDRSHVRVTFPHAGPGEGPLSPSTCCGPADSFLDRPGTKFDPLTTQQLLPPTRGGRMRRGQVRPGGGEMNRQARVGIATLAISFPLALSAQASARTLWVCDVPN